MNNQLYGSVDGLDSLDVAEMEIINGGSTIWEILGWYAGQTVRCIEQFATTAAEYQASLPANLKK